MHHSTTRVEALFVVGAARYQNTMATTTKVENFTIASSVIGDCGAELGSNRFRSIKSSRGIQIVPGWQFSSYTLLSCLATVLASKKDS
jgi:hypothetical protein